MEKQWKREFGKIALPSNQSVYSVAKTLRNEPDSFMRSLKMKSIKLSETIKFCEKCDATIIIRDAKGVDHDLFSDGL